MKKIFRTILTALLLMVLTFSACGKGNEDDSSSSDSSGIEIIAKQEDVQIKSTMVSTFDYTTLFEITRNGGPVKTRKEYIDSSSVKPTAGIYTVKCTYKGVSGSCKVNVIAVDCDVVLKKESVTVNILIAEQYDYSALFEVTEKGEPVKIEPYMITSDVKAEEGTYNFTVSYGDKSKTLVVNVTKAHEVVIINSYKNYYITESEIADFDYTTLFSVYVDGMAHKVLPEMIDSSSLEGAKAGDEREVSILVAVDSTSKSGKAKVTVKKDSEVIINAHNVETYPNSEFIDLTTLFEIKDNEKDIPVTMDMIKGTIDYSKTGDNQITLEYKGNTSVAIVKVLMGVVIGYKTSDTVFVTVGENKNTYGFEEDFILVINGVRFYDIRKNIDFSSVNFDKVGNYTATLSIKYNEKNLGLHGPAFTTYTKSITYCVVENDYSIKVKDELLILPEGTESYDVFSNIVLKINGIRQSLTENKESAEISPIACYAQVVSNPIDFTSDENQEVLVDVYVNGASNTPVRISYELVIRSDVEITGSDSVVFSGKTIYTKDFFRVKENGKYIDVTPDMVSGKVDTFTPGRYEIELNYKNASKKINIVVVSEDIKDTYKTNLVNFDEEADSAPEEDYGSDFVEKVLDDIVISEKDGVLQIKSGKSVAEIVKVEEADSFIIRFRSTEMRLTIRDGVAVFVPVNSLHMHYTNLNRPLIYFAESKWDIYGSGITINSSISDVLVATSTCYTINAFNVIDRENNNLKWFAIKTALVEKNNADYYYEVESGEAILPEDFAPVDGVSSLLTLNGESYNFNMLSNVYGKIIKDANVVIYDGITFKGTINGEQAELKAMHGGFTLFIKGELKFSCIGNDINSMENGGIDYATNTVFLYDSQESSGKFYSYKMVLDRENRTFTYIEPDGLAGLYTHGKLRIFIDGYGTGFVNFGIGFFRYPFEYTRSGDGEHSGNMLALRYKNTKPSFQYGKGGYLFIDEFLNVITAHSFSNGIPEGARFENKYIEQGMIVTLNNGLVIGKGPDNLVKPEFLKGISIKTKDGYLTESEKNNKNVIDISKVTFTQAGFYQFTIKSKINGKTVEKKYVVQVVDEMPEATPFANTYGKGLFYAHSLAIDKYGRMTLNTGDTLYNGSLVVIDEKTFNANLRNKDGRKVFAEGTLIRPGTVLIRFSGDQSFQDYYTVNQTGVAGTNGAVLRYFKDSDGYIFVLGNSLNDSGVIVDVSLEKGGNIFENGAILKLTTPDKKDIIVCINAWNDAKKGLVVEDGLRGTYTDSNGKTLVLDGFGKVNYNNTKGVYKDCGKNRIFVTIENEYYAIILNNQTLTYTLADIPFDKTLINGKIYYGQYMFQCKESGGLYQAYTSFHFRMDGTVGITSESADHDDIENGCESDLYEPLFVDARATYSVVGDKVVVSAGKYEITFVVTNVFTASEIECESTTIPKDSHGYFSVGTGFSL